MEIGQDALILKNTVLGFGSIIGAKSVVSKSVPRYSLAVGSPAKVIREGVVWDREEVPRPEQIEALKALEGSLI